MSDLTERIVRASSTCLRVPRDVPVRSSYATYDAIHVVAVQLETENGIVGQGWTNLIGTGSEAVRSFLDTEYLPIVDGADALHVRELWDRMFLHSISRGRKGVAMYALSAVDIALWDIVAQRAELPLHHVLGAVRERVPVYGNGCWLSLSTDELRQEAERYVELGCVGVKVKIGTDHDEDLRRLAAVRDVIGPDRHLMVDANQRYDPMTAVKVARGLAEADVYWFEEPLTADSIHDYERIASQVDVPIAAGENEYSRFGFRELIEHRAVSILQPDVHRVGGITEFMRIAALAEAWNLPVAPHTSYELHTQLLGSVSTGLVAEYYDWFPEGFFQEPFPVVDGHVAIPDRPGIGARFAPDVFERFSL